VAGLGVRLYTDEMTSPDLARALQREDYDALSCHDAGLSNRAISDEDQLAYASREGRAILTFNASDFLRLDREWKAASRRHAGIIIVPRPLPLGRLVRSVARHLDAVSPDAQDDVLLWLDVSPIP